MSGRTRLYTTATPLGDSTPLPLPKGSTRLSLMMTLVGRCPPVYTVSVGISGKFCRGYENLHTTTNKSQRTTVTTCEYYCVRKKRDRSERHESGGPKENQEWI